MFHTQAWNDIVSAEQSEKMQKVLDTSVDQIAGVCCHIQTPFQNVYTLLFSTFEHHQYIFNCFDEFIILGQKKFRRSRKSSEGRQQKR